MCLKRVQLLDNNGFVLFNISENFIIGMLKRIREYSDKNDGLKEINVREILGVNLNYKYVVVIDEGIRGRVFSFKKEKNNVEKVKEGFVIKV